MKKALFIFTALSLLCVAYASDDQSVQASAQASIRVVSSVSYDLERRPDGLVGIREFYTRTHHNVTISGESMHVQTSSNDEGVVNFNQLKSETVEIIF